MQAGKRGSQAVTESVSEDRAVTQQDEQHDDEPGQRRFSRMSSIDSDSHVVKKKSKFTLPTFALERVSKVLVIYTGGTIGMLLENGVYVPKANFLLEKLIAQPLFNDANFAQAYEEAMQYGTDKERHPDDSAFPEEIASSMSSPLAEVSEYKAGCSTDGRTIKLLATPEDKKGRRVAFNVIEYNPLLDSSNMTHDDYIQIATDIKANYEDYTGFVILHGTDTMAYTASALSFMCENLGKPVILTGSQVPILETLSDGRSNFLAALILAAHYCIPEVCVLFNNQLFRGCCATKCHASNFSAFDSPNCQPLAEVEINITVNWPLIFMQNSVEKFDIEKRMSQNVALLRLFPTLTADTIEAFFQPPIKGIILQTYGAGNAPVLQEKIVKAIKKACDRGVIFVNITQCYQGSVNPSYATGMALIEAGVVPGSDMTPECALMKLSYVLGKEEWNIDKKREMLKKSLRGELHSTESTCVEGGDRQHILNQVVASLGLNFSSSQDMEGFIKSLYPSLMSMAAKENNVRVLESMFKMGAGGALMDYDKRSPLHVAAACGSVDCVKLLLERGSPVHGRDRFGNTPLIDAVRSRQFGIIKLLRDVGAHLHLLPTQLAHELCSLAAQNDVSHLEAWILAGADPNIQDYDYQRPLSVAVEWNRFEAVEILLKNGADPSLGSGSNGESPLELANRRPDVLPQIISLLNRAAEARKAANLAYSQVISSIASTLPPIPQPPADSRG